eukprot:TRINITY_DN20879_c0_g1_i1.p1 TRINITY_DN20879_c0_g1~~TRINITY_DN20879_c0_g1_i1.p1  ORF type:complete len:211 (+),score=42.57 TRINITY_DN20879_c0_g1_i1:65-634(+)
MSTEEGVKTKVPASSIENRPIEVPDKEIVEKILINPKNAEHLSGYCRQWKSLVRLLINRGLSEKTMHVLTIDNEIIGFIIVEWVDRAEREASIEYVIDEPHWGNGYGTQAARIAVEKCRNMDAKTAIALIVLENIASHRIMKSLNFEADGFHTYEMNGSSRKTAKYVLNLCDDEEQVHNKTEETPNEAA